jgi:endo-beta-N-acetylglucosaminidase D
MAKLTEKKRDSLPDSKFGLPDEHKYPMPDKALARNAKARASQQQNKGRITAAEEAKIDRKADKVLGK